MQSVIERWSDLFEPSRHDPRSCAVLILSLLLQSRSEGISIGDVPVRKTRRAKNVAGTRQGGSKNVGLLESGCLIIVVPESQLPAHCTVEAATESVGLETVCCRFPGETMWDPEARCRL